VHAIIPVLVSCFSSALLLYGQPDESFQVARQGARERLPDDPDLALHLVQLARPTGQEHTAVASRDHAGTVTRRALATAQQ